MNELRSGKTEGPVSAIADTALEAPHRRDAEKRRGCAEKTSETDRVNHDQRHIFESAN
jgi:hypothetical protein